MPYTMADWKRDFITEHIKELSPDERRQALEGLSAEERVEGLSLEEIEKVLRKLRG